MSTQMWSSFPDTSYLFMSYLVLLPFPCDLLALISRQIKRFPLLSSAVETISVCTTPSLCFPCPSIPANPGPVLPWAQTMSPVLFLSVQSWLPSPEASIPSSADVSLAAALPQHSSNLPTAPQKILGSPSYFCPFPQPVIFSSQLPNGLSSLPAVAEGPPVPHPQLSLVPHLCFQSCLLSPLPGTARAAAERLFEPPELHSRAEQEVSPTLICQGH